MRGIDPPLEMAWIIVRKEHPEGQNAFFFDKREVVVGPKQARVTTAATALISANPVLLGAGGTLLIVGEQKHNALS